MVLSKIISSKNKLKENRQKKAEKQRQIDLALSQDKYDIISFLLKGNKLLNTGDCKIIIANSDSAFSNEASGPNHHAEMEREVITVPTFGGAPYGESLANNGYLVFELTNQGVAVCYAPDELSDYQLSVLNDVNECINIYNSLPGVIQLMCEAQNADIKYNAKNNGGHFPNLEEFCNMVNDKSQPKNK